MTSLFQFLRRWFGWLWRPRPSYLPPDFAYRLRRDVPRVIEWVDSASINGGLWVSREEISPDAMTSEGLTQRTVGWLIDESPDVILLAQSIGQDRLGAVLAIPKAAIISG